GPARPSRWPRKCMPAAKDACHGIVCRELPRCTLPAMIAESESTTLPAHKTFSQRLALLFVGLASILLTVGIGVWFTTDRFVQNSGWVSHSHEVEGRV